LTSGAMFEMAALRSLLASHFERVTDNVASWVIVR